LKKEKYSSLCILLIVVANETLILKGIKFRGTKTKGHEYKHIEEAWDEGSPNTLQK